jgi:hypothetical protein
VFDVIEDHVDHGRLIDHEEITVEWIFFVLPEASRLGVDLKKPMDRLGLVSGCLGHAFGRTSGRRAQEEADFFRGENAQDGIHEGGLADTRAASVSAAWITVFWLSASARPVRASTHGMAFSASMDFQGIAPRERIRSRSAIERSA